MRSDSRAERATRRRLSLLALLHTRPHRREELIASLNGHGLFIYDHATDPATIARQQLYQFRHDIDALRRMKYDIVHDRRSKYYSWQNSPFGVSLDPAQ